MKVFTLVLFPVTLFGATVAKEDDLHIMNGGNDLKNLSVHSLRQKRKLQPGGWKSMGPMCVRGHPGGRGGRGGRGYGCRPRTYSSSGGWRRELGEMNSRRELGSMLGSMPEAPALPSSYSYNPSLFNDNWKNFTLDEFYEALQCEQMPLEARPIHDASTWSYLRQTYEDIVGSGRSSIHKALSDIEVMDHSLKKLLPVQDATSVVVNKVPKKGRGIHASRDIKEGEHIWSDVYLAAFYDTNDINRFLAVIPPQLACDIILWKYDYDENPNDFFFSVNLDSSSFCNDGGSSNSNIMWQSGPIANNFVASRDINAGDEILCDYGYDNTYE